MVHGQAGLTCRGEHARDGGEQPIPGDAAQPLPISDTGADQNIGPAHRADLDVADGSSPRGAFGGRLASLLTMAPMARLKVLAASAER